MLKYSLVFMVLALLGPGLEDSKFPQAYRDVLEKADQFELLSLNPEPQQEKSKDDFHGWKVLGKTTVKDEATRKKLIAAFKKGVADNDGRAAKCFNPRHGIRASHDGKTADFVICFECLQVSAFMGDKQSNFLTTESPASAFNEALKDAKVPLSNK
jgi:hypothetical protein